MPNLWRADTGKYASADSATFWGGGDSNPHLKAGLVSGSHRWARSGNLEYKMPIPEGFFEARLFFIEMWPGASAGSRQMVVKINGNPVPQAGPGGRIDVFTRTGGLNKSVLITARQTPSVDGFITVTLVDC